MWKNFDSDHDKEKWSKQKVFHFLRYKSLSHFLNLAVLENEDKIQEIFDSVDENHDEVADPWEMHDWMLYVESHVQKFGLDEQWYTLGQNDMDNITWPDYVFKVCR